MGQFHIIGSALCLAAAAAGCDNRSPSTPPARGDSAPVAAAPLDPIDATVMDLFTQYNQLAEGEKDTLAGDKLIIKIEGLLGAVSHDTRRRVARTVEFHNKKMLKRALEDTSAIPEPEVVGTETLGQPREKK